MTQSDLPIVAFSSQEEWRTWLEKNHDSAPGVWIRLAKKGTGVQSVSYAEAVEEALCFGWIDGQSQGEGAQTWLQKFTGRRSKSIWSAVNRKKAIHLIESGRMKPSGIKEVERARADGRWEAAYDSPSAATVPNDLQAALEQCPEAKAFFEGLDKQNRYAVLFRIQTAKKPETRERRIRQFVEMLKDKKTLYPRRGKE